MTQVWIYTVSSSGDPDNVDCVVPLQVDDGLIFFGPCKTRIRERIRDDYLSKDCNHRRVNDDLFIVGINGANKERCRKVVWAGELTEVMTFAEAFSRLTASRFKELRDQSHSPLHVSPIQKNGKLVGYKHRGKQHLDGKLWISDLVSGRSKIRPKGQRLMIPQGMTPWETFDRDCCMLLENRFFAQGQGIEFDEVALKILTEAQPGKSKIDSYAIFGLAANGDANGLRGHYLKIDDGKLANRFVEWLEARKRRATVTIPRKRRIVPS